MSDSLKNAFKLPPEQQAIRDKCLHPSGTFVEFPIEDVETSIPERFEKIVKQYPDHTAIKIGEGSVTYSDLNAMANRVARALLAQGTSEDKPVALLFDKGVEQIAAMIGVLKAGRFFVPLDALLPKSRLEMVFEDCLADLTLTNRQNISLANAIVRNAQPVIKIESFSDSVPLNKPCREISPEALAFIVHTSGSTGRPKGVINTHRMVLHHLMLRSNGGRFCPLDRIPHLISGTSNAIISSLSALLNGATLLPFDVNKEGVRRLRGWLVRERATILQIAAPLFRNLCEVLTDTDRFPDLRLLRLSSETVCKADVDFYKRYFSHSSLLVNGLNSSEALLLAEYFIDQNTADSSEGVPVGYAVRDKEIVLLDEHGGPVGYNEVGEIVVRSEYLSPGYWRNPGLTATKFRDDPDHGNNRTFYTGDLGLMLPDGCLIHKGRKDFRVKVRGYSVEIGEVEKALRECVDIEDAVVVAESKVSGETRLIAYLTSQARHRPTITQIRRMLKTKLPDYMIPSTFVILDALPLGPSGKVDRRALPDPGNRRPELDSPLIAPRTDLEKTVARIFTECTGIDSVGIEDNFFDLGGDSLLLARLASRLSATLDREFVVGELFECPSVAGMARLLEAPAQFTSPKNEIIKSPAAGENPNQLSFAQQRLWFLEQLNPGDPAYNLLSAFQISGELNIAALERSLNAIIARHEVLRTVFESVDGQPRLKVLANVTISLNIVDLGERKSALEDEADLRRYCTDLAQQPFDLSRGPLLRVSLLRRRDEDFLLLFAVHHIVFDAWSMGVFWSELSACYESFCNDEQVSLPKLAIQYAGWAGWQRNRVQHHLLQKQLDYWRGQLDGTRPLPLLTDRPRPPVQSSRGAKQSVTLSADISAKVKRLSHDQGTTLFMTLLAAFQSLLHRYTSQDDIAIGCPVAGRDRPEVENLIGFFLNVLIFRVDVGGEPNFLELLSRVRQVCLAAYANQDLPFERLVEELHPERHLSRNPLVDVAFAFQNTPHVAPQLYGTSVSQIDIDSGISRFDLQLFLEEYGDQLRGHLSYNTDLFDEATIARMAEHFCNLVASIVADPEQRISELPLLSQDENRRLLIEWNDTGKEYAKKKCLHQLFEEQVERTPDAIALIFEDQQLTYRELNSRANRLAHYLHKRGVGADVLVGICFERSMEMVVGLLGILKAGGGYVPLDPSYPKERLEFMLADAQVSVLLTQEGLREDEELSQDASNRRSSILDRRMQRIWLDTDWQSIAKESDANPENSLTADSLAYVIYTSGSTGRPKGVAIEHRNTAAFLAWAHGAFTKEDLSGVLASTSICFDLSVFEIFAPLSCGGTVILVENALALATISKTSCVSLVNTVPSAMTELLNLDAIPPSVRVINLAGEPLRSELVRRIYVSTAVRKVHDLYGPTECTTYSTWICRNAEGPQTIGRPIANTLIYILDAHRNPAPIGVAGEIYIGGDSVARGYLNRPEQTAEKFIYHSFDGGPAQRLYRTGDLARYSSDGSIEFLGRIDNQVKIRGYRIELGEIEAALGEDPWIQDAVVIARGDLSADNQLIAYVVPKRQTINSLEHPSWEELQEKQVSEWQTLFERTFTEAEEPKDPTTNTAGVNSSYTNAPIPAAESRDWVEHAAQRILSLSPNRVLDIGCGLGRTLFRIAPYCTRYWGADFSQAALDYVERHLDILGDKRADIKLIQAHADDLSKIPAGYFDTVIINGVTQYFPHIEHLVKVLEGALNAIEPGGVIFVGDVRSLPLLEAFQLSVELFRASDDVPAALLWQTVKRNVAQDEELLVDPAFFSAICRRLTKIERAEVLLKRGWAENELTRFRYDVILYVKPREQPCLATAWLDWSKENLTLSSVRELLLSSEPRTLGIARVPNARVLPEHRAAANLVRGGNLETVRVLRDAIETMRVETFQPESFWALQDDLPYWVDLTWSNAGGPECFDVFLQRRDFAVSRRSPASFQKEKVPVKPWHMYAHNPTEAKQNRWLGSFLRSHLKRTLPDYMIPSAFVVLDALPLTPNGKIDRKALSAFDGSRSELDTAFIVPSTPIEEIIATIWKDVLGIQRVGIHDNFFDLGGHSLLATQVVARMRKVFQSEIPFRHLFEFPTIAELAATISGSDDNQTADLTEMEQLLVEIEAMSDDEAEKLLAVDGVRNWEKDAHE